MLGGKGTLIYRGIGSIIRVIIIIPHITDADTLWNVFLRVIVYLERWGDLAVSEFLLI